MPPSLVGADGIKIEEVREVVKTLREGNLDEKEKAAKALDRLLQAHPLQRKENARATAALLLPLTIHVSEATVPPCAARLHAEHVNTAASHVHSDVCAL